VAGWTKKVFSATGITEFPPGPGLVELQASFGGSVILALDVSGSMFGDPLQRAQQGCRRFIEEAIASNYSVGLILWDHAVKGSVAPSKSPHPALDLLAQARAVGGNDIVPCLDLAHRYLLECQAGDMVVAIFGDGDLGDEYAARSKAANLVADNIRILTCGLGDSSAESLAVISTESITPRTATPDSIVESIASMATGLTRRVS